MLGSAWTTLHEKWEHTLGNLTLTGYNPELGNASFADKLTLFAASNVSLNRHFTTSGLYVFTNTSNSEKVRDINKLVSLLDFPDGSVEAAMLERGMSYPVPATTTGT